ITRGQIKKLEAAGIRTLSALACTSADRVPRIEQTAFERLREQANLQVSSRGKERPDFTVLAPRADDPRRGLALLPPPSPGDVFFDMEGFPLIDGGLEYLFGATHLSAGGKEFTDWWAHDDRAEKAAFERFVDWIVERWQRDP